MTNIGNTNEIIKEPNLIYKYLDQLNFIEDKSGINGRYIVIAIFSCFIIVFIGVLESAITNLVGIFIPAYLSLKAIDSLDNDVEKQWITYWILFWIFSFIDYLAFIIIQYIPFYYSIKYLILVWLFLPNFKGAAFLYDAYIYNISIKIQSFINFYFQPKKKKKEPLQEVSAPDLIKINKPDASFLQNASFKSSSMDETYDLNDQKHKKSSSLDSYNEKK